MLTVEEFKQAVPAHLKSAVSQDLVDGINNASSDPELAQILRDNIVGWTKVLTEGRWKMDDYLNAVAYVSFKLMGHSNQDAYKKTFPQRYQSLAQRGATDKDISAYVSAYNKGKLVTMLLEQSLVPTWILNADVFQEAINTQVELMRTANSEKVRTEAANSILTHLKRPETKHVQVDISPIENTGVQELHGLMSQLAQQQLTAIKRGVSTREIAHQTIDVTPSEDA